MKYALVLAGRAESHIANAIEWYESQRLGLGWRFGASVREALRRIAEMPYLGAPSHRKLRCLTLTEFPYNLYYRVGADVIEVRALIHQRRKPNSSWRRYLRESPGVMLALRGDPACQEAGVLRASRSRPSV